MHKNLSETAFLVNESRARMVAVSKDVYAHLWVTAKTKKLWNDFAEKVYPHDDLELGIRNRYFLEHLNATAQKYKGAVFVNIGCGFTSYPFLIKKNIKCIEIDLKCVIDFKKSKITQWQKEGKLPDKQIDFISLNVEKQTDLIKLEKLLSTELKGKHSFILLEGITYYLQMPNLKGIFKICARAQETESSIGFDYWTPEIKRHPVFVKLIKYFANRFDYKEKYNLFDAGFITSIADYEPLEITSITDKERLYSKTDTMSKYSEILPTGLAIVKRRSFCK